MKPFETIRIRTAAIVLCNDAVALIKRTKNGIDQYTVPGGNVEPGESIMCALRRELFEELGLQLAQESDPLLIAVQDQMVSRPGSTPPPRKIHLIFHHTISAEERAKLASVEHDDLSSGEIVWMPIGHLEGLHLFPAIGGLVGFLNQPTSSGLTLLQPLTDDNYQWL